MAGELSAGAAFAQEGKEGATADVVLKADDGTATGTTVATTQVKIDPGSRSFRVALSPTEPIDAGDYTVRVTARGATGASVPATDVMHITLPEAPVSVGALLSRRGPSTINRDVPTADLRFRRTEQIRIELPTTDSEPMAGRLLDRTGKALPVPISVAMRDDADGSRWMTARLALAPLAAGDYIIELGTASGGTRGTGKEQRRMLVAFRVIQ